MRFLFIATLALFLAPPALAQPPLDNCAEVPDLAGDIMQRRQVNYDIMLMINSITSQLADQPNLLAWAQSMIDDAYVQAVAATPQAREQQVEEFKAQWTQRCTAHEPAR